jgi:hypothetical protein
VGGPDDRIAELERRVAIMDIELKVGPQRGWLGDACAVIFLLALAVVVGSLVSMLLHTALRMWGIV